MTQSTFISLRPKLPPLQEFALFAQRILTCSAVVRHTKQALKVFRYALAFTAARLWARLAAALSVVGLGAAAQAEAAASDLASASAPTHPTVSNAAIQVLQRADDTRLHACCVCGTTPARMPCVFSPCGHQACFVCSAQHILGEDAKLPEYAVKAASFNLDSSVQELRVQLSPEPIGVFARPPSTAHEGGVAPAPRGPQSTSIWEAIPRIAQAASCLVCQGQVSAVVRLPEFPTG